MKYLTICSIIKNEGRYIEEWLNFHRVVGVEHFYLFDNNSTDNTREILEPYINDGLVTYTPWPMHPGQLQAYAHALEHFKNETKWMAFIDADEFLHGTRQDDLKTIISGYEDFSAIAVHWKVFGTSFREKRPQGLVIENYLWRAEDGFQPNGHPKSIVQIAEAISPVDPHVFLTQKGTVNESKTLLKIPHETLQTAWSYNHLAINHYFTKSREDYLEKMHRGRAMIDSNDPAFRRKEGLFIAHDRNDVRDETVLRFLPELKNLLKR